MDERGVMRNKKSFDAYSHTFEEPSLCHLDEYGNRVTGIKQNQTLQNQFLC